MVAKKWLSVSLGAALMLVFFVSLMASAGIFTTEEQYQALQAQLAQEEARLARATPAESVPQGLTVKELSAEVGKLESELHPNPKAALESEILAMKAALSDLASHYRRLASDPAYAKQLEQVTRKQERLRQIEQAFKAQTKTPQALLMEIKALQEE